MSNRSGTNYSAPTDADRRPVMLGVSTVDGITPVPLEVNPVNGQLQVSGGGGGGGSTTIISPIGQTTMAASVSVAIASNQSSVPVTVGNFPATQPISGTVTANQGTSPWVVSGTVTANAGTNLNTSLLALESGGNLASIKTDVDNLALAQGSATSGQKGNLALTATTTAAPTYTTAQSNPLSTDTAGNLRTSVNNTVTVTGTVTTTPSGTQDENLKQVNGAMVNVGIGTASTGTQRVAVSSDSFPAIQAVSGTVTANAGSGTFNIQSNASVNVAQVAGTTTDVNTGNASAGTQRVVLATNQPTLPISAASLPLPTLAATSTKQSDGSQKTQVVDGSGNVISSTANALDVNVKSGGLGAVSTSGNITGSGQSVTLTLADTTTVAVQVTGTFNATMVAEKSVDGVNFMSTYGYQNANESTYQKNSFTSADVNNIWTFDVAGSTKFRLRCTAFTSGTAVVNLVGVTSSNQIVESFAYIIGQASNLGVNATQAGNWSVRLQDGGGTNIGSTNNNLNTQESQPSASTLTNVTMTGSSVTLLAGNSSRRVATIYNDSGVVVYVKFGSAASSTSFTIKMVDQSYYEVPNPVYTGIITALGASGVVRVTEIQ